MNKSGISKQSYVSKNQILANAMMHQSFGVVVSNTGVSADSRSRKVIKAGTPLSGDLDVRTTAFKVAADTNVKVPSVGSNGTTIEAKEVAKSNAVGVLLHDVDVTDGNANATILVFGFVNTNMLDQSVKSLITASVKEALAAKVTFVAC